MVSLNDVMSIKIMWYIGYCLDSLPISAQPNTFGRFWNGVLDCALHNHDQNTEWRIRVRKSGVNSSRWFPETQTIMNQEWSTKWILQWKYVFQYQMVFYCSCSVSKTVIIDANGNPEPWQRNLSKLNPLLQHKPHLHSCSTFTTCYKQFLFYEQLLNMLILTELGVYLAILWRNKECEEQTEHKRLWVFDIDIFSFKPYLLQWSCLVVIIWPAEYKVQMFVVDKSFSG